MSTGLDASVRAVAGQLRLEVDLAAPAGQVVAVVGPNGAGKTTLVGALAGLVPLVSGHARLDGHQLDGPPERRPIGVVFQEHRLFPHLTARDNVAFGIPGRKPARRAAADAWLARVGLADRGDARPAELSGGQAQRVALARALAHHPRLLLLDEPLAALDATTRSDVRRALHRHLAEFSGVALLVTHDPVDAFALADRLVVLEAGRVVQDGTPAAVAAGPRSAYAAELVGTNLVAGVARGGVVVTGTGVQLVAATRVEGPVLAVIAPSAVSLHRRPPEGSPRNVWEGRVRSLHRLADRVRVDVEGPIPLAAEVTHAAADDLALAPGEAVWMAVKATEVVVNPV